MLLHNLYILRALALAVSATRPPAQDASQVMSDPLTYGPELELVHLYYDEFPTGIAVSSTGRLFSNYPPGLDANNTNNGQNGKYTIAELFSNNTGTYSDLVVAVAQC